VDTCSLASTKLIYVAILRLILKSPISGRRVSFMKLIAGLCLLETGFYNIGRTNNELIESRVAYNYNYST